MDSCQKVIDKKNDVQHTFAINIKFVVMTFSEFVEHLTILSQIGIESCNLRNLYEYRNRTMRFCLNSTD